MYLVTYQYDERIESEPLKEYDSLNKYVQFETIKDLKDFINTLILAGYGDYNINIFKSIKFKADHKVDINISD